MYIFKIAFLLAFTIPYYSVEIHPQTAKILVYLKVKPDTITLENGFTRDVSNIGHYGTGDLEVTISNDENIERAKHLINMAYDVS